MQNINLIELTSKSGNRHSINSLNSAESFCKSIATGHYENFPVASALIPKQQRQDIYNIYAFARVADDIADTLLDLSLAERSSALNNFLNNLIAYCEYFSKELISTDNEYTNPILLALSNTIIKLQLPILPFEKLIKAFIIDVNFAQAVTFKDLEYYCEHSANPVGELVLRVFNTYDEPKAYLSNCVCTALQLANFWQDFSEDLPNNRCFIPKSILEKYELNNLHYSEWNKSEKFIQCLDEIYCYTEKLFEIGEDLIKLLKPRRLKMEIYATLLGGKLILNKTRELGVDIINVRPKIKKSEIAVLLLKTLFI